MAQVPDMNTRSHSCHLLRSFASRWPNLRTQHSMLHGQRSLAPSSGSWPATLCVFLCWIILMLPSISLLCPEAGPLVYESDGIICLNILPCSNLFLTPPLLLLQGSYAHTTYYLTFSLKFLIYSGSLQMVEIFVLWKKFYNMYLKLESSFISLLLLQNTSPHSHVPLSSQPLKLLLSPEFFKLCHSD